ncbi:hypothetical protein KY285_016817 [Solanum tuberosum]|nr:hypothetical protein KY285_016817 [Solanum tuberosum]
MFQIQRDDLNNELAEEHHLHESSNLKEADADYEPDEGPDPVRMKKLIKLSLKEAIFDTRFPDKLIGCPSSSSTMASKESLPHSWVVSSK